MPDLATTNPTQMYDEYLDAPHGFPTLHAVVKAAPPASGETISAGMCCHLNANSQFELGCINDQMACFVWPGMQDYDVWQYRGSISGGVLNALVACGAYELETTQYVDSEELSYAPNTPLQSTDVGGANDGLLQPGTTYTNAIVGVVSDGLTVNEYNNYTLKFWPVYLPRYDRD